MAHLPTPLMELATHTPIHRYYYYTTRPTNSATVARKRKR